MEFKQKKEEEERRLKEKMELEVKRKQNALRSLHLHLYVQVFVRFYVDMAVSQDLISLWTFFSAKADLACHLSSARK